MRTKEEIEREYVNLCASFGHAQIAFEDGKYQFILRVKQLNEELKLVEQESKVVI